MGCGGLVARTMKFHSVKYRSLHRIPALSKNFSTTNVRRDLATIIEPAHWALTSLEHTTGLSWPVLIPTATILLRATLTTPFAVLNRIRARQQGALQPLLSAMVPIFRAQLAQTTVQGTSQLTPEQIRILAVKERRKRRIELYREYGCQNWKMLFQPALQIPLFLSMSLCIRAMCGWTVVDGFAIEQSFVDQGFFWCPSLAMPDPSGALPLAVGACALANVEIQPQAHSTRKGPSVQALLINGSRFGAILFMAMSFQAPSAIAVYWLTSNGYSLIQNVLLNRFLPLQQKLDYSEVSFAVANTMPEAKHGEQTPSTPAK